MAFKMGIKIQNLNIGFGEKTLYDNFNLEIKSGEFVSILGKSGCGKSVLLKSIIGQIKPKHGKVFVNQVEVKKPSKLVSVCYQDFAILPWLTLMDNLRLSGATDKELIKNATLLKIEQHLEKFPKEVSIGIKQRASIARSISVDTNVFLMDEPLSSVDAITAETIRSELKGLLSNKTTLLVTHSVDEAIFFSNRIICLKDGRITYDRSSKFNRSEILSLI